MTLTRTLADFEREEKKIKVSSTKVRVSAVQAIELAVKAGVDDSLETYAKEHLTEPFPEWTDGEYLKENLGPFITEGVCAALEGVLSFEDEE